MLARWQMKGSGAEINQSLQLDKARIFSCNCEELQINTDAGAHRYVGIRLFYSLVSSLLLPAPRYYCPVPMLLLVSAICFILGQLRRVCYRPCKFKPGCSVIAVPQALQVSSGVELWTDWNLKYFSKAQQKLSSRKVGLPRLFWIICFASVGHCPPYSWGLLM